jgi:hypothetical protein
MIRSRQGRGEAPGHAELARLLPAPGAPELPPDRRLLLEEHLMREITGSPRPRPFTRRLALIAVPVATAAVIVGAVTFTGNGGGETGPATAGSTLERLAAAAAAMPEVTVGDDQFVYTAGYVEADRGGPPDNGDNVVPEERAPYDFAQWIAPDGADGWYRDSRYVPEGMEIIPWGVTEAIMIDPGRPGEGEGVRGEGEREDTHSVVEADDLWADSTWTWGSGEGFPESLHQPTFDYVQSLPADPDQLLEKIYTENGAADSADQDAQWAFETIGAFFERILLPPEQAETMFLALDRIPGVEVGTAVDATGREGVAISRSGADLGHETTLIFEEETGAYLGVRTVQTERGPFHAAGLVFEDSAITERAVVDEVREEPAA